MVWPHCLDHWQTLTSIVDKHQRPALKLSFKKVEHPLPTYMCTSFIYKYTYILAVLIESRIHPTSAYLVHKYVIFLFFLCFFVPVIPTVLFFLICKKNDHDLLKPIASVVSCVFPDFFGNPFKQVRQIPEFFACNPFKLCGPRFPRGWFVCNNWKATS